jgi:hypothetical protein
MCFRRDLNQPNERHTAKVLCALLSLWLCGSVPKRAIAQQWSAQNGISSRDFEQYLPDAILPIQSLSHPYPNVVVASQRRHDEELATRAAFERTASASQSDPIQRVSFDSPPSANGGSPVGTGINSAAHANPDQPPSSATIEVPNTNHAPPKVLTPQSKRIMEWPRAFALDANLPSYLVGYEAVGLRRGNDTVGPYSEGRSLDRFDQDVAGRYTISKLFGSIERYEFKFTGPFHWDRQIESAGPISSRLPVSFTTPFDNADHHRQLQSARLSSYELNRCATGDEFSKFFYGLRLIDHEERFQLEASHGTSRSLLGIKTHNLLVGTQLGLDMHRPLSQRLNVGLGAATGLYGNFVEGAVTSSVVSTAGSATNADLKEGRLRASMMLESVARINYRLSQNIVASCGYEFWYFPALATTANQRLDYASSFPAFSFRSGDDQLFRGWTVGLSARF